MRRCFCIIEKRILNASLQCFGLPLLRCFVESPPFLGNFVTIPFALSAATDRHRWKWFFGCCPYASILADQPKYLLFKVVLKAWSFFENWFGLYWKSHANAAQASSQSRLDWRIIHFHEQWQHQYVHYVILDLSNIPHSYSQHCLLKGKGFGFNRCISDLSVLINISNWPSVSHCIIDHVCLWMPRIILSRSLHRPQSVITKVCWLRYSILC